MTTKAKAKINSKRRKLKWASFVALLLLLVVWYQHGIGPSADTRQLRRELVGTTLVKVSFQDNELDLMSERRTFVLQDDEARDFVHSILLQSPTNRFLFRPPTQILGGKWYKCEFYNGSKLITTLSIIRGHELSTSLKHDGFRVLYPSSYRHIYRLFDERSRGN